MTTRKAQSDRLAQLAASPAAFRSVWKIDTDAGPRIVADVLDGWQRQDFEALDPGWMRIAHGPQAVKGEPILRGYLERGRGASKTSDLALMTTWVLLASPRMIRGVAAAADKDQARLLRDAILRQVKLNEWSQQFIEVRQFVVANKVTGSQLEILASDAATSYGHLCDFLLIDELTNWSATQGKELWTSLVSTSAKKTCMMVVISNAGMAMGTGWQWKAREAARQSDAWYFSRLDGPQASWIKQDALDEQRLLLPPKAYARLWLNQWQTDAGDALDMQLVEDAIVYDGPMEEYDEAHWPFVGTVDLGLRYDHAALAVLCFDRNLGRIRLAHCESWNPRHYAGRVPLRLVEEACVNVAQRFNVSPFILDPWQAAQLQERLCDVHGLTAYLSPHTAKTCDAMATATLQAFANQTLGLYRDEALMRDWAKLSIETKNYGYKLVAAADEHGHADRAMAIAQALPELLPMPHSPPERETYCGPQRVYA